MAVRLTPEQAQLAQDYLPLTYWLVGKLYKKYNHFGYDAVYDAAINALIKSVKLYDESRGASFKTFLRFTTEKEMYKVVRYANAKKRTGNVTSIDATHDDSEKLTLHDIIGECDPHHFHLKDALNSLTEREKKAIYMNIVEGISQTEIADEFGVSQVHASRIIRKGLAKMREAL